MYLRLIGSYGIGLATRKVSLNNIPLGNDSDSWVLRNDGGIYSNGFKKFQISQTVDEGDIIVSVGIFVMEKSIRWILMFLFSE